MHRKKAAVEKPSAFIRRGEYTHFGRLINAIQAARLVRTATDSGRWHGVRV
ncbi:MAG: hypothetical protein JW959_03585 [Pirellulales bacterium]|nr:hypothetical protein [Pirellulales bacterium]